MDTIYENTMTVKFETKMLVRELEPNLHAFKRAYKSQKLESAGNLPLKLPVPAPVAAQGLLDSANLKLMLAGKPFKTLDLYWLTADEIEMFRTLGWMGAMEKMNRTSMTADPFEQIDKNGMTVDNLVRVESSSHMLFDRKGGALPVGINFSYIKGNYDNTAYDLQKLAEILMKNPDVQVFPSKGKWHSDKADFDKTATTVEEAITRVPYYNADGGRHSHIEFRWMPTREAYTAMWAQCQKTGGQYPSTCMDRVVFELDLLGARAGGAALFDDFYGRNRSEDTDDEDEE